MTSVKIMLLGSAVFLLDSTITVPEDNFFHLADRLGAVSILIVVSYLFYKKDKENQSKIELMQERSNQMLLKFTELQKDSNDVVKSAELTIASFNKTIEKLIEKLDKT